MCLLIQHHIPRARHKDLLGLWKLTESTRQGTCVRIDDQIAKMSTYLPTLVQILDNVLHLFNSVYQMQGSPNPSRQHVPSAAFQLQPLTQAWAVPACPSTCPEALLLSGPSGDHLASLSSSLLLPLTRLSTVTWPPVMPASPGLSAVPLCWVEWQCWLFQSLILTCCINVLVTWWAFLALLRALFFYSGFSMHLSIVPSQQCRSMVSGLGGPMVRVFIAWENFMHTYNVLWSNSSPFPSLQFLFGFSLLPHFTSNFVLSLLFNPLSSLSAACMCLTTEP